MEELTQQWVLVCLVLWLLSSKQHDSPVVTDRLRPPEPRAPRWSSQNKFFSSIVKRDVLKCPSVGFKWILDCLEVVSWLDGRSRVSVTVTPNRQDASLQRDRYWDGDSTSETAVRLCTVQYNLVVKSVELHKELMFCHHWGAKYSFISHIHANHW